MPNDRTILAYEPAPAASAGRARRLSDAVFDIRAPAGIPASAPEQAAPRRTRIWKLSDYLHCSVIGTCLSTAELRQILARLQLPGVATASDHDVHKAGVMLAERHDAGAKLLHKALDRRHRLAIAQADRARSAAELERFWDESVARGEIPGAYWATLTHPLAGEELTRRVFGEVHMLSHLVGAANRADIRRLCALEAENAALEEKVVRQQAQLRDAIGARDKTIAELNQLLARLVAERQYARADAASDTGAEQPGLVALVADRERRLEAETRRREWTERRLSKASETLAKERETLARAQEREQALREELSAVDAVWMQMLADSADFDDTPDLAGLSLLYVGGRTSTIAHLRAAAARCNATLLHHDGGIEDGGGLLPSLVGKADAVLFPVDCVSHMAASAVKRQCQQAGKPFLPLRSAGLTSFLAALRSGAVLAARAAAPA